MRKLMSLFIWCWLVTAAHAQVVAPPSIELRDEGSVLGRVRVLDCTGTGISCTRNGSVGTIDGSGGASGAPVDAQYWVSAANGSLSAEVNLGALGTGLVLNTAGTPSIYAGTTCTNQVIRLLSASGVATCTTVTATDVDTTIWTGTAISGILKASSQGVVAAATAGVDYAAASHSHVDADIPNTITVDLATAATALAADPADCGLQQYATSINASGTLGCTQPVLSELSGTVTDAQVPNTITLDNLTQITTRAFSDTTGTVAIGRGGTGQTTITTNQIYVGTALDTVAAQTLPSCSTGATDKLLYNSTTQAFSCGTDQTGSGSGLSHDQAMTRIAYGF